MLCDFIFVFAFVSQSFQRWKSKKPVSRCSVFRLRFFPFVFLCSFRYNWLRSKLEGKTLAWGQTHSHSHTPTRTHIQFSSAQHNAASSNYAEHTRSIHLCWLRPRPLVPALVASCRHSANKEIHSDGSDFSGFRIRSNHMRRMSSLSIFSFSFLTNERSASWERFTSIAVSVRMCVCVGSLHRMNVPNHK